VKGISLTALLALVLALGVGCGGGKQTPQLLERGFAFEMVHDSGPSLATTTDDDEPPSIASFGFWSLTRLGSGPVVFEDVQDGAKASIPYILEPDKARQGPGNWYQIHLHAKVVFGAGTGHAYLFAAHNGYASALIEYETSTSGDRRRIVRKATSYIDGSSKVPLPSNDDELRYRNYLQYSAVQPGLNHVTFSVEERGLAVTRVEILPDSGIEYTRQGPARLTLSVRLPRAPLREGQRAILTVEVWNLGGRKVGNARASLEYPRDDLRNVGSATKKLGVLLANARRRTSFAVVPLHRGSILIGVQVSGRGGNSPGVSKTLDVH
jgi:hypothetical protein